MTGMVGGTDVIFQTARRGFDARPVLDAVLEVWPDGFFQDAEGEDVCPITTVLAAPGAAASVEFFVYKDEASAGSWNNEGWTEDHGNSMAHFLVSDIPAHPDRLQLTLVIGSFTGETVRLIPAVYDVLGRMAAGEALPREGFRRVNWEADLRAVGYTSGREKFYEAVEDLLTRLFPDWTVDELACNPHEAQQFCDVVRRAIAPVPDHLVMKALMNRRRQRKKGTASTETRLLWGA